MPDTTPRKVAHLSDCGLVAATVGALATASAHFLGHLGWNASLMLYLAFLTAAVVCGVGAVLARCHLSVVRAFSAGVTVGRSQVDVAPARRREGLRVVE